MVIVCYPTGKMMGDYLTKPLNRTPFKNHCNMIMGVDDHTIKFYKTKYENGKSKYQKRIGSYRDGTSQSIIQMLEQDIGVCWKLNKIFD